MGRCYTRDWPPPPDNEKGSPLTTFTPALSVAKVPSSILPPPDVSLEEAKEEFSGEGLIPG